MKYTLIITFLCTINTISSAQKIHFCDSTNKWITKGHDNYGGGDEIDYFRYWPGQWLEEIGGTWNYYLDLNDSAYFSGMGPSSQDYFVREDTLLGIVYFNPGFPSSDYIVYNYNYHLGDTVHMHYNAPPYTTIDSVIGYDSVLIGSYYYKTFTLLEIDSVALDTPGWDTLYIYVEGIGSLCKPTANTLDLLYNHALLNCFYNEGTQPVMDVPFLYPTTIDTIFFINNCEVVTIPIKTMPKGQVSLYPNPAGNQITVEGAGNCDVVIYDLVGRAVQKEKISAVKQTINIGALNKGVYMVEIIEAETGMKTIKKILKM